MTRAIEVRGILRLSIEHAARFRRDFETGRADRQRRPGRVLLRRAARLAVHGVRVPARAAILHQAFPDVSGAEIERDVAALLADLAARGLVSDAR